MKKTLGGTLWFAGSVCLQIMALIAHWRGVHDSFEIFAWLSVIALLNAILACVPSSPEGT